MRKKILMIFCLLPIIAMAESTDLTDFKPDMKSIEQYKRNKNIAANLYDFNNMGETLSTNFKGVSNIFSVGPFSYSFDYTDGKTNHVVRVSKDLTDFIDGSYPLSYSRTISNYYLKKDEAISSYSKFLNAITNLLIAKLNYSNSQILKKQMEDDMKAIDVQYKNGLLSSLDYQEILLKFEKTKTNILQAQLDLQDAESLVNDYDFKGNIDKLYTLEVPELTLDQMKKYVTYYNDRTKNTENIKKWSSYKQKVDRFAPSVTFGASYNITDKIGGLSLVVSKNFNLFGSEVIEVKGPKEGTADLTREIARYDLMKRIYEISKQSQIVAKKKLEISKLKYSLGKSTYKDYLNSEIEYNTSVINTLKNKMSLISFVLVRELY